jgi:hypothetical protein
VLEEVHVPVSFVLDLIGVGDGDAAEEDGVALRIDEAISDDANEREFFGVGV